MQHSIQKTVSRVTTPMLWSKTFATILTALGYYWKAATWWLAGGGWR